MAILPHQCLCMHAHIRLRIYVLLEMPHTLPSTSFCTYSTSTRSRTQAHRSVGTQVSRQTRSTTVCTVSMLSRSAHTRTHGMHALTFSTHAHTVCTHGPHACTHAHTSSSDNWHGTAAWVGGGPGDIADSLLQFSCNNEYVIMTNMAGQDGAG